MYPRDVEHPNAALEVKLRRLYTLRSAKDLTLGFRPEYLNLLKAFGNPHQVLPPVIHVAGTNGKGSTIAILRTLLEAEGKRVHTYTSPHLQRFNERIVLGGKEISNEALEALIDQALELNAGRESTFFEITTAMAFAAFAQNPADFLLLETGLGGRLDCTNIIEKPLITIITALGMDHQDILGPSIEHITFEKAGIMKQNVPCVIAAQSSAVPVEIFRNKSEILKAPLWSHGLEWKITAQDEAHMIFEIDNDKYIFPRPNLLGGHQVQNAGNALMALYIMGKKLNCLHEKYKYALHRIQWKGRFDAINLKELAPHFPEQSEFWFDGGHNVHGAAAIAAQLSIWNETDPKPLHVIFGMKGDKNASDFLAHIIPFAESITHIDLEGVRTFLDEKAFIKIMKSMNTTIKYSHSTNIQQALQNIDHTRPRRILLCGSLYLAKQLPVSP